MKFTNVKQLIIKFMGGGIINFPTRFLRWVKIEGNTDGSDDGGGGGGSGSISMYDAWMKAFDGFKVYQDDNDSNILTVAPAIYIINADGNYETKKSDEEISLAFMNNTTQKYQEYTDDSKAKIYNIKDAPDDIYEQSFSYGFSGVTVLYDLDELNEKANNIAYAVESINISHKTYLEYVVYLNKGKASYVPYSGVFKINGKYYVWFPSSMD